MSDTYQAVYDAVRSKISNGDIGRAVADVVQGMHLGHYAEMTMRAAQDVLAEQQRPSVLYRPRIYTDQGLWCALYGENIQDGVAGFGETPAAACADFDKNWNSQRLCSPSTVRERDSDG